MQRAEHTKQGSYTVLSSNDFVSLVKDNSSDYTQWVSNHHLRVIIPREKRLEIDNSTLDCVPVVIPEPSKLSIPTRFKGGDASKVEPASTAKFSTPKLVQKKPPPTNQPLNKSNTSAKSIPAQSTRQATRPTRNRTQTKPFNIGTTSGQTYSAIVRLGPKPAPLSLYNLRHGPKKV